MQRASTSPTQQMEPVAQSPVRSSPKRAAASKAEERFQQMDADPLAGVLEEDDAAKDALDGAGRPTPGSAKKSLFATKARNAPRPARFADFDDDADFDENEDGNAGDDDAGSDASDFEKAPARRRAKPADRGGGAKRAPKRAKRSAEDLAREKTERAAAAREAKEAPPSRVPIDPKEKNAHCISGGGRRFTEEEIAALPVLTSPHEMFADISLRLPELGEVARATGTWARPLRVATMCSGTESPLLALEMLAEACRVQHGQPLAWEHVFSCEIEPFKQAYIERNFSPPLLFRDIRELDSAQVGSRTLFFFVVIPSLLFLLGRVVALSSLPCLFFARGFGRGMPPAVFELSLGVVVAGARPRQQLAAE